MRPFLAIIFLVSVSASHDEFFAGLLELGDDAREQVERPGGGAGFGDYGDLLADALEVQEEAAPRQTFEDLVADVQASHDQELEDMRTRDPLQYLLQVVRNHIYHLKHTILMKEEKNQDASRERVELKPLQQRYEAAWVKIGAMAVDKHIYRQINERLKHPTSTWNAKALESAAATGQSLGLSGNTVVALADCSDDAVKAGDVTKEDEWRVPLKVAEAEESLQESAFKQPHKMKRKQKIAVGASAAAAVSVGTAAAVATHGAQIHSIVSALEAGVHTVGTFGGHLSFTAGMTIDTGFAQAGMAMMQVYGASQTDNRCYRKVKLARAGMLGASTACGLLGASLLPFFPPAGIGLLAMKGVITVSVMLTTDALDFARKRLNVSSNQLTGLKSLESRFCHSPEVGALLDSPEVGAELAGLETTTEGISKVGMSSSDKLHGLFSSSHHGTDIHRKDSRWDDVDEEDTGLSPSELMGY